jgi:hypothetical protein
MKPTVGNLVIAHLNDRAQPIERGERYEDPLDGVLRERELGAVTGGGTLLGETGEVEHCEIEIELVDSSAESVELVVKVLEHMGAPKGSRLVVDGRETGFGVTEGLALYLNGTDLPDDVYRDSDVNVVYDELTSALGELGGIRSYWEGPTETALYMYGTSFEEMRDAIAGFLGSYPLCERARVVRIA